MTKVRFDAISDLYLQQAIQQQAHRNNSVQLFRSSSSAEIVSIRLSALSCIHSVVVCEILF